MHLLSVLLIISKACCLNYLANGTRNSQDTEGNTAPYLDWAQVFFLLNSPLDDVRSKKEFGLTVQMSIHYDL